MGADIDLPSDGRVTREYFDALPGVPRGWSWELLSGHLELTHMPVTGWHWEMVLAALDYWRRQGHAVAGNQYVADSEFAHGEAAANKLVADGVVFKVGHQPDLDLDTHDGSDVHAVIEVVSTDSGERDAAERLAAYAHMGIPNYWIIRKGSAEPDKDGLISVYELADGEYRPVSRRSVSQL